MPFFHVTIRKTIIRRIIISVIIILFFLTPALLSAQGNQFSPINDRYCLLLESGLSDAGKSTIKFIVWTEEGLFLPQIEEKLQATDYSWDQEIVSNYFGRKAFKFSTSIIVQKEKEKEVLADYVQLNGILKEYQAIVYLEEKIESSINAENYFALNNCRTLQEVKTEGIISTTGYCPGLPGTVRAGEEAINIQILTKEENCPMKAKTVLALPALMEEF